MEDSQPIILYHDSEARCVRAAAFPRKLDVYPDALLFQGRPYTHAGQGIMFWDYLAQSDGSLVGVVLVDFDFDPALGQSPLLTQSSNVTASGSYGSEILLASPQGELKSDVAQAFGSALYLCDGDALLLLDDWYREGYAFPLDERLIELA